MISFGWEKPAGPQEDQVRSVDFLYFLIWFILLIIIIIIIIVINNIIIFLNDKKIDEMNTFK